MAQREDNIGRRNRTSRTNCPKVQYRLSSFGKGEGKEKPFHFLFGYKAFYLEKIQGEREK